MGAYCLAVCRQPLTRRPLHEWLAADESVVLMTPADILAKAETPWLDRFAAVEAIHGSYESWMTDYQIFEAASRYDARRVVASSEDDVLRLARVRERLNIPGQSLASAWAYRDKWEMVNTVINAGVAAPRTFLLHGAVDLVRAAQEVGFPLVVKPRRGVGSEGVRILRSDEELRGALHSGLLPAVPRGEPRLIAQEYIDGNFFHIDGVMDNGAVVLVWPGQYSSGLSDCRFPGAVLTFTLLARDHPDFDKILAAAGRVISALPPCPHPNAFHLEVWVRAGEVVFCEIASRPGGGPIVPMFEAAFDVNLSQVSYRGQAGLPVQIAGDEADDLSTPTAAVLVAPGHGRFSPPASSPPAAVWSEVRSQEGASSAGPTYVGDCAFQAVYQAPTVARLAEQLDEAAAWWAREAEWT